MKCRFWAKLVAASGSRSEFGLRWKVILWIPRVAPAPTAPSKSAFYFILVTVVLDMLAFGIIAPVLPDLIRQFQPADFARASTITGWLDFAWPTMQFIFSPLLGAWSDRFGRRPATLIPCFGPSVDYIF